MKNKVTYLPIAGKNTKQYKDLMNLRKNLQTILDRFDSIVTFEKRPNYLMAISISCKPGNSIWYYGTDPVADEHARVSENFGDDNKWKSKKRKKTNR